MSLWRRLFAAPPVQVPLRPPAGAYAQAAAMEVAPETPAPMAPAGLADRFHRHLLGMAEGAQAGATPAELGMLKRLLAIGERFDMRGLPRLPSVLPQLLRSLRSDRAAGAQLAELVGRDPVLVGEVMRVTSSVQYRTAQPIHSLQQAVVLLGQDGLRRIATQHVMKPILQASATGPSGHTAGECLWDHAERCAHACTYLGRQVGGDGFEAFLAGMVCHTGTGAVIRLLEHEVPPSMAPYSTAFLAACMQLGAQLSLRAAVHWELPEHVIVALRERTDAAASPPSSSLGKALLVADVLAMALLLAEGGAIDAPPDYGEQWPACFAAPLVRRCQQDLRQHFRAGA
ncbi:HDOD domain-containing protein [Frateuria defendens]|uniref:HDOD domain-containing protein n=1 Tax=Frateuria defendens TaxID=2219559 RepID=UPI00066FFECE|nr:HDOD domain-containing protein [Frateuria defendens]